MDQNVLIGIAVFLALAVAIWAYRGKHAKDAFTMPSLSEPSTLIVPGLGLLAAGAIYFGFSSASKCKKRLAEAEAERDSAIAMLESAKRLAAKEEADAAALVTSAQQLSQEAQQTAQVFAGPADAAPTPVSATSA